MKKIKLTNNIFNQYKSVYEDSSAGVDPSTADTSTPFSIDLPQLANENLTETIKNDVYKNNIYVRVKMTKNYYDAMTFPTACTELNRLVQFIDFPGYLKDLGGRLDSDPKISIQQAPDLAAAAFTNTEFDIISYDPNEAKKTNEQSIIDYNFYHALNEEGEAAALGTMAGNLAVQISKEVASGVTGFANAVAPTVANVASQVVPPVALGIGGMWGLGYGTGVIATKNTDHGYFWTNDKQYNIDYTALPKESIVKSNDPIVAIDTYIRSVQDSVNKLLSYITAKSARSDIADLERIVNTLNGKANKTIQQFIRDNNETFKLKQEQETRERMNDLRDEAEKQKALRSIYSIIALNQAYNQEQKTLATISGKKLNQINAYLRELQVKYSNDKKTIVDDSKVENYNNPLNEDSYSDIDTETEPYIIFNADPIYDDIKTTLSEKIIKILGTDPEDWDCIKFARKEMDLMQEQADKEIQTRIEVICRMGNVDDMGLGQKLTAFIRKHPLRASYLKGLWARYMRDLDVRKQKRLDNIITPSNASPMKMCQDFLKITYPNLMAMMITYKTLIQLITDSRCRAKVKDVIATDDIDKITEDTKTAALQHLEVVFGGNSTAENPGYGCLLASKNNNNKPIYNVNTHKFLVWGGELSRFGIFMQQFVPGLNKDNIDTISYNIMNLKFDLQDTQKFFQGFINMLNQFNNVQVLTGTLLEKYFEYLKTDEAQDILDYLDNIKALLSTKKGFYEALKDPKNINMSAVAKFRYLIAYIISSKGKFLKNYEKVKNEIVGLKADDKNNKDKIKQIKDVLFVNIDTDAIAAEMDEELSLNDILSIFRFYDMDSYLFAANLYYKLVLYKCTEYGEANRSNINYKLIHTFVEIIIEYFDKFSILLNDDSIKYELINFKNSYTGTNGNVDSMGFATLLHNFIGTNIDELKIENNQYPEYAQNIDKQLKSKTPMTPKNADIFNANKIHSFDDIKKLFNCEDADSIDALIHKFTEDTLDKIENKATAMEVFKTYFKQVIDKFDEDFQKSNTEAFDSFIGTKDDNEKITDENILVGYTNGQAKLISFQEFLGTYSTMHDSIISLADITPDTPTGTSSPSTKDLFIEMEKRLNEKIREDFLNKTQYDLDNQDFFGSDGIFLQLSKLDMTRANIIAIIKKIHVVNDGQIYEASTEMLVRNSLLNFLPEIFKIPLVTGFINLLYGDAHGKIYTISK